MKRCAKCGSELGQGQVTCEQCGCPIIKEEEKKCPFCETYCEPFAKVCSSCGHPLFAQVEERETKTNVTPVKDNVILFDAKKLKKQKAKQLKNQQQPTQPIGKTIFHAVLVVLFVLGVISMFL